MIVCYHCGYNIIMFSMFNMSPQYRITFTVFVHSSFNTRSYLVNLCISLCTTRYTCYARIKIIIITILCLFSGPFYRYYLSMDAIRGDTLDDAVTSNTLHGQVESTTGKVGDAIYLDGGQSFVDLGDMSGTCLGDISLCQYGLTLSMWVNFGSVTDGTHLIDSGEQGFRLYIDGHHLWVEFQRAPVTWSTSWDGPLVGKWYFIEVSWHHDNGVKVWVDLELVASQQNSMDQVYTRSPRGHNLYIGRSNTDIVYGYLMLTLDEVEMWYGDRDRLIYFDFIQRGLCVFYLCLWRACAIIKYSLYCFSRMYRVDWNCK